MWRSVLIILGWLALALIHMAVWMVMSFEWNFLVFSPKLTGLVLSALIATPCALGGYWLVARVSTGRFVLTASLAVCVLLFIAGIRLFVPEGASSRLVDEPSPLWFRGTILATALVPCAFWVNAALRWSRSSLRSRCDERGICRSLPSCALRAVRRTVVPVISEDHMQHGRPWLGEAPASRPDGHSGI